MHPYYKSIKNKRTRRAPVFRRLFSVLALTIILSVVTERLKAQTFVSGTLSTGTLAPGQYYNNTSIVMGAGFSVSGATGAYSFYTTGDCTPINTQPSYSQNFIITSIPRIPGYVPGQAGYSTCQVMQTIQYIDGLGRPVQTIAVKGSAGLNDVVLPNVYDEFDREATKYLPFTIATSTPGAYEPSALTSQGSFYTTPPAGVTRITSPVSGTAFEPSPLNRPVEQGASGDTWQLTGTAITTPNTTPGHTVKVVYTNNNATPLTDTANSRLVALYRVTVKSDNSRTLTSGGYYLADQLYVTVIRNENWTSGRAATTEEYKDKSGHMILKRAFNYTGGVLQFLSTYYVYDDLGNLCFVLPPAAIPDAGLTSAANQTTLNNLCYQYAYDARNRLYYKQLPGKGAEYMVYNPLDQVVFHQDAVEAGKQQWEYIKYDGQGRVIMTGIENQGSNYQAYAGLQSYVTNMITVVDTVAQWEKPTPGSGVQGYTDTAFPWASDAVPLVVNYYDDYTFQGAPSTFTSLPSSGAGIMAKGLLTASKKTVLNTIGNATPDRLWTVDIYDGLGRPVQTYAQHYLGGVLSAANYDVLATTYNFNNQPLTVTRQHHNTSAQVVTINNTYTYDHIGRKTQTFEQINGGTTVLLSQANFNEVGQVMGKYLHSTNNGSSFLQGVTYAYNERGWLLSSTAPLFAMQLEYNLNPANVTGFTAQYNGNISSQVYTSYNQAAKNYVYSYDYLNRLTGGTSSDNYNESGITYDLNGNITTLNRTRGSSTFIDQLTYTYNSTNRVQGINDQATDTGPFGYRPGNYTGYSYDANGSMTVLPTPPDGTPLANINIQYNMLSLPQAITGGRTITYTYDATGNKLRRVSATAGITDYVSGIEYDQPTGASSETLSFIQTEEGKAVLLPNGSYDYTYYLGDNLGNTRVTFDTQSGAAAVQQQDDYYPFGLEISRGTVTNPKNYYLYNGKELQADVVQYDYGARFYDPVIARWNTVDPLAEVNRAWSPYNYVKNNSIRLTDPDGMLEDDGGSDDEQQNYIRSIEGSTSAADAKQFAKDNYDAPPAPVGQAAINQAEADGKKDAQKLADDIMSGKVGSQSDNTSTGGANIGSGSTSIYFACNNCGIGANQGGGASIKIFVVDASSLMDVGHTAIQLNSNYVFGYYPSGDGGSASLMSSKGAPRIISRSDFDSHYGPQGYTEYTLSVTANQLSSLQKYFSNVMANPGNYNLFLNNCTSVIISGLESAGVGLRTPTGELMSPNLTSPALFGSMLSMPIYYPMPEIVTGRQHYGGN